MKIYKNIVYIVSIFLILQLFISCQSAALIGKKVNAQEITDGVFQGSYKHRCNEAVVEVTIENHQIVKIDLIKHDAWKGGKANDIIPRRIIDNQSTRVDAVSGATNSSHVIMNAVQKAIEKSIQHP